MKRIALLLCLCLLLAGCAVQPLTENGEVSLAHESEFQTGGEPASPLVENLTPDSLEALLEVTNTRRRAITKPAPDTSIVENWNFDFTEPPFDTSAIRFDFEPSFSETDVYTLDQAQADIEYLFFFYELGYGPYFHFGGKEAFDAAKEAVLADLEGMDEIAAPAFEASLIKNLSFVDDAHFVINHNYNHPMLQGYISELSFLQDTAGFIETMSGKRVHSVGGREDFAEDMVLSVTPEGEIAYRYLILSQEQPEPVKLEFEDGEAQTAAMLSAHEAAGRPEESEEVVSLSRLDDIPVINISSMGFPHANEDWEANEFLELAKQLRDEPVLIIDLRHNGGGNGLLPQMWYEAYTGSYITPNHYNLFRLDLYNAFGWERSEPDPESFYYIPADVSEYYIKPQTINESWELQNPEPRQVFENDRLLILLTSKNTASAADNFTDLAFNVENTLVIGSNTTGMFVSAAATGVKMPNSGMVGQMGYNLAVFNKDHFQEGVGFLPDLWVTGDALDAAIALAKQRLAE